MLPELVDREHERRNREQQCDDIRRSIEQQHPDDSEHADHRKNQRELKIAEAVHWAGSATGRSGAGCRRLFHHSHAPFPVMKSASHEQAIQKTFSATPP